MKFNRFLTLTLVALFVSVLAYGQKESKEGKMLFNPHWYLGAQVGVGRTIGEMDYMKLVSPAAALTAGYQFSPVFSLRGGLSGWEAKGGFFKLDNAYKFNYAQLSADAMFDLGNLFAGYKYNRIVSPYVFAGIGVMRAFNNDEAIELSKVNSSLYFPKLWTSQFLGSLVGRVGVGADIRLSEGISLTLEANTNAFSDKMNSKKGSKFDHQCNALVGLKFRLGKSHSPKKIVKKEDPEKAAALAAAKKAAAEKAAAEKAAAEKAAAEKAAAEKAAAEKAALLKSLGKNIFFSLNSSKINDSEVSKIDELIANLKKYPETKISITGYADKSTGNVTYNQTLSEARVKAVEALLVSNGIEASRIFSDAKGDSEQPFEKNDENRVVVCVANE